MDENGETAKYYYDSNEVREGRIHGPALFRTLSRGEGRIHIQGLQHRLLQYLATVSVRTNSLFDNEDFDSCVDDSPAVFCTDSSNDNAINAYPSSVLPGTCKKAHLVVECVTRNCFIEEQGSEICEVGDDEDGGDEEV